MVGWLRDVMGWLRGGAGWLQDGYGVVTGWLWGLLWLISSLAYIIYSLYRLWPISPMAYIAYGWELAFLEYFHF